VHKVLINSAYVQPSVMASKQLGPAAVTLVVMRWLRCGDADRIMRQRWCRACLTAYARERRARFRLAKRAPELLAVATEAVNRLRETLQSINAFTTQPNCCARAHFRGSYCGCVCHRARAWLESVRIG
jgi:hypothetical protein